MENEASPPGTCGPSTDVDALRDLVRRAAPFVNAVLVMADDRTPSLQWLHDAGVAVGTLGPESAAPPEDGAQAESPKHYDERDYGATRLLGAAGPSQGQLTGEQLRACENAVSFAGYPYFADQGPEFVNDLLDTLARLRSLAGGEE